MVAARPLFLSCMGFIYLCAYVSFYLQFPRLNSADGLLPAKQHWKQFTKQSALLAGFSTVNDPDIVLELLSLAGIVCSFFVLTGITHHGLIFFMLFWVYLTLYTVGTTFLTFQWDIFLLETGFLTIFYAPWLSGAATSEAFAHPMTWVLRVSWVKFMLMSGAVKVFAQCPTWRELTALEVHFASTCLPTSEAWVMHSLPPTILRAGVAFMFVCELLAPWLLLAPITPMRRVGVVLQLLLQIGIAATGNYNWFNLHTTVLLLPAWAADASPGDGGVGDDRGGLLPRLLASVTAPVVTWERMWAGALGSAFASLATVGGLLAASFALFPVTVSVSALASGGEPMPTWSAALWAWVDMLSTNGALIVESRLDEAFVRWMLDVALRPDALGAYVYTMALIGAVAYAVGVGGVGPRSVLGFCSLLGGFAERLLLGVIALLLLGVTLLPFDSIAQRRMDVLVPETAGLRDATLALHRELAPLHVSNSYGLFRRMTGVGPRMTAGVPQTHGWNGLPPTRVQVPVVVIEGHPALADDANADASGGWREIPLRYTPSATDRAPRRTAPHQPRLDWQMWFAALGSYEHNPWLLHLAYKLLLGTRRPPSSTSPTSSSASSASSTAVLDLLDADAYPFPPDRPPQRVRMILYHYDFTRTRSEWARRTPGATLLHANCSRLGPYASGTRDTLLAVSSRAPLGATLGHLARDAILSHLPPTRTSCSQWWSRRKVKDYLPAVDRSGLEQVVRQQGWPVGGVSNPSDPCSIVSRRAIKNGRNPDGSIAESATRVWQMARALLSGRPGTGYQHGYVVAEPVCRVVVALRGGPGAALRRLVGWRIGDTPASTFVDGPLVVICGVAMCALALRVATRLPHIWVTRMIYVLATCSLLARAVNAFLLFRVRSWLLNTSVSTTTCPAPAAP